MGTLIYSDTLPGGKHWSMVVRRNTLLRLTDIDGGANVGMLFYNPAQTLERYNAPDTLKCQHTFKLTAGHCLYSDMGRVFCTIVADSFGWHDTVCGNTTKAIVAEKWGATSYQTHRNDWQQNGRDSFLVEGAKYGLQRRDLAANLNIFSKVAVADDGQLSFDASAAQAGAHIDLRFEMDTLVLMHTCPHPLNTSATYPRKTVRYDLFEVASSAPLEREPHLSVPENARGLENNRLYHACACC
ncbi:MAG: urea amidolyase associated protein UAAP1 [Hyphomicrobium sp.]